MQRLLQLVSLLILAALSGPCCAWNRAGHMLSGAVAYHDLAQNHPKVVEQIVALMSRHPQWAQFEAEITGLESDAEAEVLFMYMARWADDIRGQGAYDHPKWHYVNIPYVPAEAGDQSNAAPQDAENILSTLATNTRIIRDSGSSDAQKAIALCWLFHQVGDLHQPLHVVSMITPELPAGDKGGNLIFVRRGPESSVERLHAVWDNAAVNLDKPASIGRLARRLTRVPSAQRSAFQELTDRPYTDASTFERWAREESYPLAVRVAYQGGTLAASYSEERAVVLSSAYMDWAKELSLRRVILSGYRLADVLTALFPPGPQASRRQQQITSPQSRPLRIS